VGGGDGIASGGGGGGFVSGVWDVDSGGHSMSTSSLMANVHVMCHVLYILSNNNMKTPDHDQCF